jgi:glycosyltransferase involved in cell wall biosynthesis
MNICLLGKYPPIEGGVSANTYWLARGLAERGHRIHVVTNAFEVDEAFRMALGPGDDGWYQAEFPDTQGCVRVYNVEPFSPRRMDYIPSANPFVSKLAAVATDVVRRNRCDVILSYYYEPYVVAGWLASRWTNRPLVTKHAGSDLDRLYRVPDLSTTYREILRSADAVVTQPRLMPRFLGMGVDRSRLERDIAYSPPGSVFNSQAEPLDIAAAALGAAAERPLPDASAPIIGTYGKIGIAKGTYDLIAALGVLAREGLHFRFAAMVGAVQRQSLAPFLERAGLTSRTYILPMMPNWKVPAFLRACSCVCFLERDFPIAIHGPIIPREILACGTCLVLSGEIAGKQRYRDSFAPGENLLIVNDPRNTAGLAATLRTVIDNPANASTIGENGMHISRSIENYPGYIDGWEQLLSRYAGNAAKGMPQAPSEGEFEFVIPDLLAFLRRRSAPAVAKFRAPSGEHPFEVAIRFCDFMAGRVDRAAYGAEFPKLLAALAYAKARLRAAHFAEGGDTSAFVVSDRLFGAVVSAESAWDLRPVRGNSLRIEEFDYDVSGLEILASVGGHAPTGDDGADLASLEPVSLLVLFHRAPNLIPCELRIDDATRELVARCDGTRTTAGIVDEMRRYFNAGTEARDEVTSRVLGALDRLYRAGVLVFGEYRPGWGWTGGSRGDGLVPQAMASRQS